MPTYSVFAPRGRLTPEQKTTIAADVTKTHTAVTGAQGFFAQVVFTEVEAGNWFMGGKAIGADQIFLSGNIRGGRPPEMMASLVLGMRDVLIAATGLPKSAVWCYLLELPPSNMVEYGYVLPQPGKEKEWLAEMPEADRRLMESVGR